MVDPKTLQALMRHMGVLQSDAETLEMIREAGGMYCNLLHFIYLRFDGDRC